MSTGLRGALLQSKEKPKLNITLDVKNAVRKTNKNVFKWAVVKPYNCTESFTRSILIHNLKDALEHTSISQWDFQRFKKLIEIDIDAYGFVKKIYLSVNRHKNVYLIDKELFEHAQSVFDILSYEHLLPENAHEILKQSKGESGSRVVSTLDFSQIQNFKFGK